DGPESWPAGPHPTTITLAARLTQLEANGRLFPVLAVRPVIGDIHGKRQAGVRLRRGGMPDRAVGAHASVGYDRGPLFSVDRVIPVNFHTARFRSTFQRGKGESFLISQIGKLFTD